MYLVTSMKNIRNQAWHPIRTKEGYQHSIILFVQPWVKIHLRIPISSMSHLSWTPLFLWILTASAKQSCISTFNLSFQRKKAQLLTSKTKAKKNPQSRNNSKICYEIFQKSVFSILSLILLNDTRVGNGQEATWF